MRQRALRAKRTKPRKTAALRALPKPSGVSLIIGLGNPGEEYAGTRHNAGADAVRLAVKRAGLAFSAKSKLFADVAEGRISGRKTILASPTTFMNQSGKAAAALTRFFRIPAGRAVIVHDDMDLPFSAVKIVFGRGSGGHKGVESVFRALKTKDITRVRVGTMGAGRSQKPGRRELENIVVKRMTADERQQLARGVRKAADAVAAIAAEGTERTMNAFN